MSYYYISGFNILSKKWQGQRLDYVNRSTKNYYASYYEAEIELLKLKDYVNNKFKDSGFYNQTINKSSSKPPQKISSNQFRG